MKTLLFLGAIGNMLIVSAQVSSGQSAYYKFDNSGVDSKGSNNAKVYNCLYVNDRFGNANSALYFKGLTTSFANLGSSNSLKPGEGSVSVWVNVEDTCKLGSGFDYNPIILAKNSATITSYFEGYCLYFKMANRKFLTITTKTGTLTERFIFSDNSCNLSQWYHLVMCYDTDSLWLYVDNVLQDRKARGWSQTFASGDSVLLGASKNSQNDRYLKGAIDDLRIYNRVLSEKEIDSLYNEKSTASVLKRPSHNTTTFFYPNPSKGTIHFDASLNVVQYSISDLSGKLLLHGAQTEMVQLIAPPGVYLVQASDRFGNTYAGKLTITR